jgi:hypothetical protein
MKSTVGSHVAVAEAWTTVSARYESCIRLAVNIKYSLLNVARKERKNPPYTLRLIFLSLSQNGLFLRKISGKTEEHHPFI